MIAIPSMLTIEDLQVAYGNVTALRGINVVVPARSVVSVMGRNGVGKTTLMKSVMGILKPQAGSISFNGQNVTRVPTHRRVRDGMAYVPQGRMIFPRLTVEENLLVGLGARTDGVTSVPPFIYELFPVLKDMGGRRGGDLSGGQQQQLAIGRALMTDPKLIILDEPTEGIQPNIIQHIGDVLKRLTTEFGMTVLIVEQYLDFVREFSRHFIVMNRGQVAAIGETEQLTPDIVHRYLSV